MALTDPFSEKSATYARSRPTYPDALFEFVAAQVPARGRAWDCATGNGQAAIGLARYFDAVEATDASEQRPGGVFAAWGYKTIAFPFAPIEAPPLAVELRWTLAQFLACAETWTATRRYVAEHGRGILHETAGALARAWGDEEARIAVMDLAMRCGRHAV